MKCGKSFERKKFVKEETHTNCINKELGLICTVSTVSF